MAHSVDNATMRRMVLRYGPLELASIATALIAAAVVWQWTGDRLAAAFAGAIGESVGFYGVAILRHIRRYWTVHGIDRFTPTHFRTPNGYGWQRGIQRAVIGSFWLVIAERRMIIAFVRTVRDVVAEFGVAEVLDTFVVRPALMAVVPALLGPFAIGILVAKALADIVFYGIANASVRAQKRLLFPQAVTHPTYG